MAEGGLGAWVESKHPRDEKGQFSTSDVAKGVSEQIAKHPGGFSFRPPGASSKVGTSQGRVGSDDAEGHPTSGIMVSTHANFEQGTVIDMSKAATVADREKQIGEWVERAWKEVKDDPNLYIGGWVDPESHKFYGDVSRRYPESQEKFATRMGEMNNQKSIYHIGRNELIKTGGTGEKTLGEPPRWIKGGSHSENIDEDEGQDKSYREKFWRKQI
jgi:hypothetical protein